MTRLRSPYSFRFGVFPHFLSLKAAAWTSSMQVSSKRQPPDEVAILSFDGTSLGIRSLLPMPPLMPLCGLALLGCEVPGKAIVHVWV